MKKIIVTECGIPANSNELITDKLQELIESLKEETTIVFPKGKYLLSTIFVHSNLHFVFEKGCLILGSNDFYDYALSEKLDYPTYQDASHSYFNPSLFVSRNSENISFEGQGVIDMQSTWDEDNIRDIVHRGAKAFALRECKNVLFDNFELYNVTDLAIYFAGCEDVIVRNIKMRVYIDGVSPDNSKNVLIENCDIEAGDDAIVFKSSYTLNRLGICENIEVRNCKLKSRCNAIKFGTETNGGFKNILLHDINIKETRITGISIESVDGAIIDGVILKDISMTNVGSPLFIHLGKRLRGPEGTKIGEIKNILIENLTAKGPYEPYNIIEWNYVSYVAKDKLQYPWIFGSAEGVKDIEGRKDTPWQFISNVCGLKNHNLKNIVLRNVSLELSGGCKEFNRDVPEEAQDYPEVYVYGKVLPASGIYFRHIDGLTLDNVKISTINPDVREPFVFDDVNNLKI